MLIEIFNIGLSIAPFCMKEFVLQSNANTTTKVTQRLKHSQSFYFEITGMWIVHASIATNYSGANNSEWDKDTDRRNLNSKVEYLSLALPLNILFLLLVFIGFNTCKVRFGISYIITIIIVQAIVNVGLLSAWSYMFFVEHMMNTLDNCDLQEKVPIWLMHMSIMILQCQKKYNNSDLVVQSLYIYNRTRVVWECHGYKRDREPSGVPVRMWNRLRKLENCRVMYGAI